MKSYYIYYSEGTNHDNRDDVAVTEANSLSESISIFKGYYTNVSEENVKKIDLYREGYVQGIHIISNY